MQMFPPGMTELNPHKTPTPAAPDAAMNEVDHFLCPVPMDGMVLCQEAESNTVSSVL